ncbi:MAG: class I tRNA ligase family protein, partial [Thermales bacterium]|nr:class I tRNA ligase family protein [Thermales bacterium]
ASLHVGHLFRYTVPDIYARFLRMQGYNVMFPMGWDAFGLPAEEYARKTGINPRITTETNIANLKQNILKMGYGVDWSRELATTDPQYYKWTQWIFKKFYEAGLAEEKDVELWWCEELGTVLANEEVYDGEGGLKLSERGDHVVERKTLKQWVIKITEYGEKLLEGLDQTNFPNHVKAMQKEWIGRSEGVTVAWDLVPDEYINHINNYPDFVSDEQKDYKVIVRERSTGLIRIRETGEFVAYRLQMMSKEKFLHLSGGAIEEDETPQMTFVRETREELGLRSLNYICDLGSTNFYGEWVDQTQHSVEHYFLFEMSQNDFENRSQGEVDDPQTEDYGEVSLVSVEDLRANNWDQLNCILDNYEEYQKTGKIVMVESQNSDILLATTNQAKIDRYKNFINFNGVNLKSPKEMGIEDIVVEETGENELENARIKAKAYWNRIQEPTLGADTGIYLEGVPEELQPGKDTKRAAGVSEDDEAEVVFDKMTKYYIDLVERFGKDGQLGAYFLDAYALFDGMNFYTATARREIIITDKVNDKRIWISAVFNIFG